MRCIRLAGLLASLVLGLVHGAAHAQAAVAAAADLKFAVEEVAARFTADTGKTLRLSFGSSGNLAIFAQPPKM